MEQEDEKKHRKEMKHIYDKYVDHLKKIGESTMFSDRTTLFLTPKMLIANENYDVTEVLLQYEVEWSVFKNRLLQFQELKKSLNEYEDDSHIKDWLTPDFPKISEQQMFVGKGHNVQNDTTFQFESDNSSNDFEPIVNVYDSK